MNKSEARAVILKAFEDQLKAANKVLNELFREPTRKWICRFADKSAIAGDCVKAFIRPLNPLTRLNTEKVGLAFKRATKKFRFTHEELIELIDTGVLEITDWDRAVDILESKRIIKAADCQEEVPGGWTNELRLLVTEKGRFEGLAKQVSGAVDIEGSIRRASEELDREPVTNLPTGIVLPGMSKVQ